MGDLEAFDLRATVFSGTPRLPGRRADVVKDTGPGGRIEGGSRLPTLEGPMPAHWK
jgi:hypothetical protein